MPSTPYAARLPSSEKGEDPVTVLVTGFGPFLFRYPRNSSWEIASSLPALIPASATNPTPIHIHVHHQPIRVAYKTVVDIVPHLLPPQSPLKPDSDVILHIGLAASRKFFALEQGAMARGYGKIPDVNGEEFPDSDMEEKFPPSKFPLKLTTSFDTADVLARWRENLGYASVGRVDNTLPDVRLNPDAGNFLCGFIYYNSLAHYYEIKGDERPVVFCHVPDLSDSNEKLEVGVKVAVALIKALVESRRNVGVVKSLARFDMDGQGQVGVQTDNNFT